MFALLAACAGASPDPTEEKEDRLAVATEETRADAGADADDPQSTAADVRSGAAELGEAEGPAAAPVPGVPTIPRSPTLAPAKVAGDRVEE